MALEGTPGSVGSVDTGSAQPQADNSAPQGGNQASQGASGTPSHVDIGDDTLVRIPGQDQPVKYGELYKRLQANATKANQTAAAERKAIEAERAKWSSQRDQEQARLQSLAQTLIQRQQGNQVDPLAGLDKLPYLDGATAAKLYQTIQSQGIQPVVTHIQQQNQVIQGLYGMVKQLKGVVDELHGGYQKQNFGSKLGNMVTEAGLDAADPEVVEFAKELYSAYEGDDLDIEFPSILKTRWDKLNNHFSAQRQKKVDAARNPAFPLRGGNGVAGKPAGGLTGRESSKELSEKLWDTMQMAQKSDRT